MIVPMTQIELIGRSCDLDGALRRLQNLTAAEVVRQAAAVGTTEPPSSQSASSPSALPPSALSRELSVVKSLRARIDQLDANTFPPLDPSAADPDALRGRLDELSAAAAALDDEMEDLRREAEQLSHQAEVLSQLSVLVPELASMAEDELQRIGLATVVVVLDDPDGRIVALLREQLTELVDDRFLLVTTVPTSTSGRTESSASSVGCLLIVPHRELSAVESLLGADRIVRVEVPDAYAGRSLGATVDQMRTRLAQLSGEHEALLRREAELLRPHEHSLAVLHRELAAQQERDEAAAAADIGDRTFVLRLWVPRPRLRELTSALTDVAPTLVVAVVPLRSVVGEPPVLLRSRRRSWRPYERLVGFLSWPSPAGMDPSGLMAVVLPFLFGVMVGDVVYGLILAAGGWWLRRRWPTHPVLGDAGRILLAGGIWATVFGVLFGEALGSLGNTLGMPALWFYRGGPAALQPLLLFAVAIGAAHIVLGVLLGLWSAIRARRRSQALDRAGTLLVLVGLFALAGMAVAGLPTGLLTPAVIAILLGLVIASVSHGALGLLLGPLELLGTIGNVLSYLRIAAVGLASVYLANVANELAVNAPLLLGLVVAAFFHILNLALAAFSPTVQALRLHYVEFFSKFYDGGGRLFAPLGGHLPALPVAAAPERVLELPTARLTPAGMT